MSVGVPTRKGIFVHPGTLLVGPSPTLVTTVIGSCVCVCLRDKDGNAGGMAHYLLPRGRGKSSPLRYAAHAIPELVRKVLEMAPAGSELEAKIAGGASVLPNVSSRPGDFASSNVEVAHALLGAANVDVVVDVTGGERGRKVIFEVGSGNMWVQDLGATSVGE